MTGGDVLQIGLNVVGLILALLLLRRFGPRALLAWGIYAGAPARRMQDAGPAVVPPPPPIETIARQLGELGFERLGERSVVLPNGRTPMEWLLRDGPATTVAYMASAGTGGALLFFYSAFADGAWLTTGYPQGEVYDRQELLARYTDVSVADAVALRGRGLDEMRPTHGDPVAVRTVGDSLGLDAQFRQHHAQLMLRRVTLRAMTPALLAGGLVLVFVAQLFLGR